VTNPKLEEIYETISALPESLQQQLYKRLKQSVGLHPLEAEWNISADTILDAIARSADITRRGIRGTLAEASLKDYVLDSLEDWQDVTPTGDYPFDYLIRDGARDISIQVKNQRTEKGKPKLAAKVYGDAYVVETQKTRTGTAQGKATRPYYFGEFDILAVCLHPSAGRWDTFHYTLGRWLLPHRNLGESVIATFQPVAKQPNDVWTDDLLTCIEWFGSDRQDVLWKADKSSTSPQTKLFQG
jgi:hypothetical protein